MSEGQREHTSTFGGGCENRASCEKRICDRDRRKLLGMVAAGGSLSLAGCTGMFTTPVAEERREEYDVKYAQQNRTIQVRENQTILGAGEDQGMELPYDCRAGFCGACLSRANGDARQLVNMDINDYGPLTDAAVRAGYFLPCTSRPRTHLELDTSVTAGELQQYQEEEDDDDDDDDTDDDRDRPRTHTVTYLLEQWSIEVPEDENILEAGEARGLSLPYQCRVGNCGQCLSQADGDASELIEMTVNNYDPLDEAAIEDGYFLTCTGHPRADFTFESHKYNEL